jgi:agmatine deiminase
MIIDCETNTVYFSELITTDIKFEKAWNNILSALNKYQISYKFLKATKDIWARDYMPVQITNDKFIQFRYEPSYLDKLPHLKSIPKEVCYKNEIVPLFSDINIDGGNVIKWHDRVILTDRIYSENPNIKAPNDLDKMLEDLFETEVIIIPQINSDFTGHADGLVRFFDRETIIGNNLEAEYKYWSSGMKKVLNRYNFNYINMPLFEYKDKNYPDTAIGCYMNYLEIGDVILFPIFEVKGNKDNEAFDLISELYPNKRIEAININDIANFGGLMNCISWNIKKTL